MYYYQAILQYDGTDFFGFQWQQGIPTIQNSFNEALGQLIKGKVTTTGASRTDSGVHALGQVVKISSEYVIDELEFPQNLNLILSPQIRCLSFSPCEGDFKPSSDHLSKEYRYLFTNEKFRSASTLRFVPNFSNPLDMAAIQSCVNKLKGIHDFKHFYSQGSNVKSTVREIYLCELKTVNPHSIFPKDSLFNMPGSLESCFQLKIIGNGFLKQMIRHIVSALWMVGSGKLTVDEFSKLLEGSEESLKRWKVAPANGLFLFEIKYK